MPVEFLSDEQAAQYGRYAGDPTPEQLSNFFFLSEAELALIAERRRDHNQLGFAVQLCTLRFLGSFLPNPVQVPSIVVRHVADQLHLPARVIARYALREETRYQHRRIIVAALGYCDFDGGQAVRLIRWLYAQLALSALRRREVFAPGSDRYGDPRAELLHGVAWDAVSNDVCRALNRSLDPQPELERLRLELDGAYREVERTLLQNTALQLDGQPGGTRLRLTPLEPAPDPPSLQRLQQAVAQRLPAVPLAALLLEVHAFTGLADAFTHVTDGTSTLRDLPLSVTAVLLAQACNIGLAAVAAPEVQALTLSRLSWVQQNYVRAETITAANARLVDAQFALPLAHTWGGGEVASADGLRFVVPVRTLHAGWNRKYFGSQRGVTYYNFTSDQFTGFHGIVIPGTLRDSLFILAGLLEQQTRLDPREIMADTHGSSDVVFGLFALLGYRFSPRLADLPDQRFWRLDREADYGALDDLSRHVVDEGLIAAHWEDMLRLAGSLKLGKVKATAVMRTLQRGGSLSGLGRAIAEFGRVEKTLFLLNYVGDEAYRRRILRQINRGEQRHGVGRAVFHGRKGELRQKYREGMEDQLGALGLVVNAIVLWNTRYMGVALDDLRQAGKIENERDISRLTPLLHGHIRMLGTYEFKLPEEIAQGQLRPLRDPDTVQAYLEQIEL
ncbi:Tn3 family transposase [Deinococcus aquatilis]|uniref:Tn3 family transposase n=1 Tax=Deinococcus aquatilis TaxID=519440 RepID=UPI000363AF53|nr:Tn3 family transposase [Deinococcus aquatilis]